MYFYFPGNGGSIKYYYWPLPRMNNSVLSQIEIYVDGKFNSHSLILICKESIEKEYALMHLAVRKLTCEQF